MFHFSIFNASCSQKSHRLDKEVIFLDCHTLEDLRNSIYCLGGNIEQGFLLIEDVIYCKNEQDCYEFVQERRKKSNEYYRVESIENQPIKNITFRLGQPFHFVHNGNCVHQILLTYLRTSCSYDDQNLTSYPLTTYQQLKKRERCQVCREAVATDVTYDDVNVHTSPFFWCNRCFISFHFKADETLAYEDFKHFKYQHN